MQPIYLPYDILLIEDCQEDVFLIKHLIKQFDPSLRIADVPTGKAGIAFLQRCKARLPKVVFLDLSLPGFESSWRF